MLSLGFVTHRFGIYLPSAPAARLIDDAISFVSTAYPFWNRTKGADHLLPFTGDDGSAWLRGRLPRLEHALFITHWGFQCNDHRLRKDTNRHCVRGQLGFRAHRSGQDIVIPPLHSPHTLLPRSIWMEGLDRAGSAGALSAPSTALAGMEAALSADRTYRYLLYFVGKVRRLAREGDIYSGGVRQRIYEQHANRTDFYLKERSGAGSQDLDALRGAKFCLAPHGTGFGMRQFDALVHGCVPLIVQVRWEDDIHQGGLLTYLLTYLLT